LDVIRKGDAILSGKPVDLCHRRSTIAGNAFCDRRNLDGWLDPEQSCSRKMKQAFSLVETLVAILIISLLAAVLAPALAQARRSGLQSMTLSHGRQVTAAMLLYNETSDSFPLSTDALVATRLVSGDVLLSPLDPMPTEGYAVRHSNCVNSRLPGYVPQKHRSSFETWGFNSAPTYEYHRELLATDSNPGILATRVVGDLTGYATGDLPGVGGEGCGAISLALSGKFLRFRLDGSAKSHFQAINQKRGVNGEVHLTQCHLKLFSDVPEACPEDA
jgi:prepilin-type N-terminal cleavage/methylation domain-containing protein